MSGNLSPHATSADGATKITFFLPSLAGGGAEKVFVDLANEYVRAGHQVTMICAKAAGPFLSALDVNIRVVDLRANRILLSLIPLWRFLRTHQTDVIVSAMLHANIGLLLAARVLQNHSARIIVQDVAPLSGTIGGEKSFLRVLMRKLYPRADACLAISDMIADEIRDAVGWEAGSRYVEVLPNPVVLSNVKNLSASTADHPWIKNKTVPVILAVGRLSLEKDFPTLLRAFANARSQRPLKLIVIGEGDERAGLEALADQLGVVDDVSMPGFVENPYGYMANADVVAVSSLYEGFSLVILEALATGISLVVTNCGDGPMSMVENGKFAEVVPIGDHAAMAEALLKRIDAPFEVDVLQRQSQKYDVVPLAKRYLDMFLNGGYAPSRLQNTGKHLCFFVPSLAGGGAERLVVDLANYHVGQNGCATIICGKSSGPYLPNVAPGVNVVDIGHRRVLASVFALKRVIRKLAPDAIVANMSHANVVLLLAVLMPPRFHGRVIVQEVAQLFDGRNTLNPFRDRVVLSFMRWLYPYATRVIAISRSISLELKELANDKRLKADVLPGLIDSATIIRRKDEAVNHPWLNSDDKKVIIAIGRLSPEKDFKTLLNAFAHVQQTHPFTRLIILGEGPLRSELEAQSKALGVHNQLSMPGFVENPFSYLSRSDVFVLSSSAEGFGLVVAEALTCGCNVVVTKCSQGPIDIVDEGRFGTLIETSAPDEMAQAISATLDNPIAAQTLTARGVEFGVDKVGKKYVECFFDLDGDQQSC